MNQAELAQVARAIAIAGGAAGLARARGLKTAWGVAKWAKEGLPAEHVLWLSERTQWQITPHQLAPRLYPYPDDGLPSEHRGAAHRAEAA